jgi:hypothetical protein
MPLDLSSLSPEEIADLKNAIDNPPEDPIKTLASALSMVIDQLEDLSRAHEVACARIDALQKFIDDDLIGGVTSMAAEQEKVKRLAGLKESYGSLFQPYEGWIKTQVEGGDMENMWPDLDSKLGEMRGSEGFDEAATVKALAEKIGAIVADIIGKKAEEPKAEEAAPEEIKAEEEKPVDDLAGLVEMIKRLPSRGEMVA